MTLAVKLLHSWWGEMLKIITQGQSYTDLKLSEREREQAQNYVIWYTDVLLAILALLYLTFAREETVVQYFFKYIVPTNYNDQKMIVRERKWEVGIRHAHTGRALSLFCGHLVQHEPPFGHYARMDIQNLLGAPKCAVDFWMTWNLQPSHYS